MTKMTGARATAWLMDKPGRAADRINLGLRFGMEPTAEDLDLVLPPAWTDERAQAEGYEDRAEACADAAVCEWWREAWDEDGDIN